MSVRLGLSRGTQTVWFASDPWFVPERGLRVEYGDEELRFAITLAAKGAPTSLATAVRNLRSLVRAIDRGGGSLLIDDGVDVASYPIRDAQLQELPERLDLWPSGYARVTLVLRCDAESLSSTARTLLEQFVTETGQPVVVDPEGPAVLGLRVAPYDEPLPAAIEAYVIDGEYTAGDLIIPLSSQQYDNGTYIYSGEYTPPTPEVDIYAEVSGPPPAPVLRIAGAQAVPPYQRLAALIEPPAALAGGWQTNDCFIVLAKRRYQAGWSNNGGYIHAQQLTSGATSVPIPPASMAIAIRGATLLGTLYRYRREEQTSWPSNGRLTFSVSVTLPTLPANHRYIIYGVLQGSFSVFTWGKVINYGFPRVVANTLSETGYSLKWVDDLVELTGTSSNVVFSWSVPIGSYPPEDFAGIIKTISIDLAILAVPDSLFSTIPEGDYRIAIVGYRDTLPVVAIHYEQFVRLPSGYRLRIDFDSREPSLTHKVFVQRVGSAQWYSTSASPPGVTLSSLGTAESIPSVTGSGWRETITIVARPTGVDYPTQERSAAFIVGGRNLVPVGRLSFHHGERYSMYVLSRVPIYRLWALPRPRVAIAGAYVVGSSLIESAREHGRQVVRVSSAADMSVQLNVTEEYTRPWLMLRTANCPPETRYVLATLEDGSGFVSPASATPLVVTHPVANIPLVAVSVSGSRTPIAYYHESTGNLSSGRTIRAVIYLYNPSTTNRTVTVYLEDNRITGAQETSTSISVPAGSYAYSTIQMTLNATVSAVAISLTATSSFIIYANVIWIEGSWIDTVVRRSFYDLDWQKIEGAGYAGPVFFGWDITQKNVPASYPTTSHWDRNFSITFSGSEPNTTHTFDLVSGRFLVRAGKQYAWRRTVSYPGGYTPTVSIMYPGGTASSNAPFTPTSDGALTFRVSITKSTSTSGTITGTYSALRLNQGDTLGTMTGPAPGNILKVGWLTAASSWVVVTRIVYRHDTVTGRFMRINLASGYPLDLEFSGTNIIIKRGTTTLLTIGRPSTSPTTLHVSYASGTLKLMVGTPGNWSSVSTSTSLPNVQGMVELDGSQTRGEWGIRWLGLVSGPSAAMLAGSPVDLGSNDSAYSAFLNESMHSYWWAQEPYYVYRPGSIVLGVQRGVLEVSGKCTLVVFPITSIETRDIVDRAFVLDVLGYEKR